GGIRERRPVTPGLFNPRLLRYDRVSLVVSWIGDKGDFMSGIRGAKALTVFVGLSSFLSLADTIQKTPSVADCSFQLDPDRFLSQEGRVRLEVNDRVLKMSRLAGAVAVPAVAAESLPQHNFIYQESLGTLT